MNCFDCAAHGQPAEAATICTDCGTAVCPEHAHPTPR